MDAVGPALVITYVVGVLIAGTVLRARAGTGVRHRLKIFGPGGFGPAWVATATICSMGWPVTLAVWLARGRPEPRVVFNEKALERQRRQAADVTAACSVPVGPGTPPAAPPGSIAPPTTSYGYTAPPDAVVAGWGCPAPDCGRAGGDVPRRWPHPCPGCGGRTDPTFAEPWAHDARGLFLRAGISGSDPATREVWAGALAGWEHADALRSSDAAIEQQARRRARDVLGRVSEGTAGSLQSGVVRGCLAHGLTDAAADELLYWSARVRTAGVAADSGRRADCRNLLDRALDFLEDPLGAAHPSAPEIRHAAGLLRPAVGDVLAAGVPERAARVLDAGGSASPVVVPAARPAPRQTGSGARSEDPDRVLAAILAGVVGGSRPVLDVVRTWVPDGSTTTGNGAFDRVRRGAGVLVGASGPGSPGWAQADPRRRAEWWSERMGLVVAAAVAAASTSGPIAERASIRPAVSMAGQAFVLCAVAGEYGLTDRDDLVVLLSEVLFGRTPPVTRVDPDPGTLADVARRLDGSGTTKVTALAEIAWRVGRSLLALRSELPDRSSPGRGGRIATAIPGLSAVGGFLDERADLRAVTASGIAWLDGRPISPRPSSDGLVSRPS